MLSFKIQLNSVLKSKLHVDPVDLESQPGITVSEFPDLACESFSARGGIAVIVS